MDEQIGRWLRAAPPGAKITVTFEITAGGTSARPGAPVRTEDGGTPAPSGETPLRSVPATAMERLEVHAAASGKPLTAARWGKVLVDISGREIERAVREGVLEQSRKGIGRDHRARVITVVDMREYVSTCAQVARGFIEPPEWWQTVRKGQNARIAE